MYLRAQKQLDKAKKGLLEKWKSFKAQRVEHKKTLQERRGIVVRQEASVAQREAEVGLVVDVSRCILVKVLKRKNYS